MTSRSSIGSVLDMASYAALSQLHRPTGQAEIAAEVHRLHETGLTARDVASALRLDPAAVVNILAGQREHAAGV